MFLALSPLGERVARAGVFFSRRGSGEGVETAGWRSVVTFEFYVELSNLRLLRFKPPM
jgi:hypothetical protein